MGDIAKLFGPDWKKRPATQKQGITDLGVYSIERVEKSEYDNKGGW